MWPFNKKKKVPAPKLPAPLPTVWWAIMEIKVVNNATDKEYIFKSENTYGLIWEYFDHSSMINIKQKMDHEGKWNTMAHLDNFSVIAINRKLYLSPGISKAQ